MRRRTMLIGLASVAIAPVTSAQTRPGWSPEGPREGLEPSNPDALSPQERRHVPVIVLPRTARAGRPFDFVVQVGTDPHVMTEAHHIEWVEVTVGEERALVCDLSARIAYPIVRVPLVLHEPASITVRAHCNLHGTWRTRRQVPVR